MTKLLTKLVPVTICCVLALLVVPGAGKVYADTGYMVKINRPANGEVITTPKFTAEVEYTYDEDTPGNVLTLGICFSVDIVPDDIANLPPQQFDLISNTQEVDPGSGKVTFSIDLTGSGIEPGKRLLGVYVDYPGELASIGYMIIVDYQPGNTVSEIITISFDANPTKSKAGDPVTLTWKVTGAVSVSIDPGVGSVAAEGTKEVTPAEASRSAVQLMGGDGTVTEVVTYTAMYTLKATDGSGKAFEKTVTLEIQPLTIDEIFKDYEEWGTNPYPYTWPDGTSDTQPLVGPSWCGGSNNLWKSFTTVTNIGSYEGIRWDCNAMQYRSLVCLNQFKQEGKLIGWDYMPVEGAATTHTGTYLEHQAVAIWQTGHNWERKATILDPHDRQKPHRYSVTDGLDSIAPWQPDGDYSEVYPDIPDSIASHSQKYQLEEFDKNTGNRWGNGQGAKTPWQNPETFQDELIRKARGILAENLAKPIEEVLDVPLKDVFRMAGVFCPAYLLITNSVGERLGMLSDGTLVTEFEPLEAYYWSDENGDKQWFFALLDGTYTFNITGSSSGNFRLITYTGGEGINDYGENPLTVGQPAVLTMQAGTIGTLALADGTMVTPVAKAIDSIITAPKPAPDSNGLNWGLIAGVIAGLIVMLIILRLARRKA